MKRIISWSILIGFAVAQMVIIAPKFITASSETMYMAVVGPMTGSDAAAEGEQQLDNIIDQLSQTYTGGPLLVSVPSENAANVIQCIRDNPRLRFGKPPPYMIIGPDSLGRHELLAPLSTLNCETARQVITQRLFLLLQSS